MFRSDSDGPVSAAAVMQAAGGLQLSEGVSVAMKSSGAARSDATAGCSQLSPSPWPPTGNHHLRGRQEEETHR